MDKQDISVDFYCPITGELMVDPVTDKYGHTYVGEWKNRKYHGQGTFTWKNGSKYVGEFRNGEFHGQGTQTWATGKVDRGIFQDGVLVERN